MSDSSETLDSGWLETVEDNDKRKTKSSRRRDWWDCPRHPGVQYCMEPITLDQLNMYDGNPRDLDDDRVEELADDIADNGQLTPITVVQREDGEYNIISGNHRTEAMKKLSKESEFFYQIDAKVYDENLDEEIQWHFGSKYNEPPKQMNYTERSDNVVRSRDRAERRLQERLDRQPTEQEILDEAEVNMQSPKEKREFIIGPMVRSVRDMWDEEMQESRGMGGSTMRYVADDIRGEPSKVEDGESEKVLSTQQLSKFIKPFIRYHVLPNDRTETRRAESKNVRRLCEILTEEAIEPLFGKSYQKPNGQMRNNGRVIVFTKGPVITSFGEVLSSNDYVYENTRHPFFTTDSIDWDEVRSMIRKVPQVNWGEPRFSEVTDKRRLKAEIASEIYQ